MDLVSDLDVNFQPISDLGKVAQLSRLSMDRRRDMELVARVLPFRTNNYVVNQLIDWDRVPNDPIFQLTFSQPGMLVPEYKQQIANAVDTGEEKYIQP